MKPNLVRAKIHCQYGENSSSITRTLAFVSWPLFDAELGPKSNLGKLNDAMKNIGRNVKYSAAAAVERIGAGIQGKVGRDGRILGELEGNMY